MIIGLHSLRTAPLYKMFKQEMVLFCGTQKLKMLRGKESFTWYILNDSSHPPAPIYSLSIESFNLQPLWLLSNMDKELKCQIMSMSKARLNRFLHVSHWHSPLSPLYRQVCRLDGNLYVSKLYLWTLTYTFEWSLSRVDDQVSFQSSRLATWHWALPARVSLDLWQTPPPLNDF